VFVTQVAHQNISSIDLDALSVSDASSVASPSGLGHGVMVNYLVFETLPNHTQRFSLFAFPVPPRCPVQEVEGSGPDVPLPGPLWIPMSRRNPLLIALYLHFASSWNVQSYLPPF
jgi:hypothetical protein